MQTAPRPGNWLTHLLTTGRSTLPERSRQTRQPVTPASRQVAAATSVVVTHRGEALFHVMSGGDAMPAVSYARPRHQLKHTVALFHNVAR